MKRRFVQVLIFAASVLTGWAQNDSEKLSISTQMFVDELAGNISFDQTDEQLRTLANVKGITFAEAVRQAKYDRPIVKAVDINGQQFVSAFIRVSDRSAVSELETLGVEVQCEFRNGTLLTTMIPVDKLQDVAKIAKVSKISVAMKRRPLTEKARQATNVDDVLTLSNDAVNEGLAKKYDGTGVLLGVIDTGIDFQHIAFKDKNGNTRIKRAYVVTATTSWSGNTSYSEKEYGDGASYAITSSEPTTDDTSEDHGTHTSTTAGGSSVIINGNSTTVTDDHANATYGGMAPGADLFLAGCDLSDTYLANSFQKIINYADSKGMPVVVSNSWGSQIGPHDGTGDFADICEQYFSDSNPNHICLFAASNDAGTNGFHVSGTASSSSPLGTVINWNTDYELSYYYGILANAWTRSSGKTLACKVIVIDSSGTKQAEVTVNASSSGTTVSGLSSYVSSGSLVAYRDYVSSNNKSQILLYASGTYGLTMKSGYKLAVQFYPTNGSDEIDIWSGAAYTYYTKTPSTSGYTWTAGSDDMCVSDEATIPTAISIGSYSTKNKVTDYNGNSHTLSYTVGDIADFSSYATAAQSPTGLAYPWICAPGATIVSGVNAYDTNGDYSYINGNSTEYDMYRVNQDTTNPYGSMEGTSMATPCAAGIVALWLQAAKEVGRDLTTSDVKQIMKETAITDSYTNGTNASHFGNGKIDALAGIKYILGEANTPAIIATPTTVTFSERKLDTYTQTVTVRGRNLEGNITATLTDANGIYSIDKTTITAAQAQATDGATLTITYAPVAFGQTTATVTLSSANATDVVITLSGVAIESGTASDPYLDIAKYATIDEAGWNTSLVYKMYEYTEYPNDEVAWLTLPVYGGLVGAKYASNSSSWNSVHPQTWIETGVTQSNQIGSTTWSASDVCLGSTKYFTSATAKAVGTNSSNSTAEKSMTFYVANTTAVKLYANQRNNSPTYPTILYIYECTVNSDGTLTAATTPTKSASRTASGEGTLSITGLDASKVYKVYVSQARGYLYEIGFQTPLEGEPVPVVETSLEGNIAMEPAPIGTGETTTLEVSGRNLKGDITATLNDQNGVFSITKQTAATARSLAPKKAAGNSVLTITPEEAAAGVTIAVGFTPVAAQEYAAPLTLSTEGADDQVIQLAGRGLQPELIALDEALTFADGTVGETAQHSFDILGSDLAGAVTATLTDEAGVFSISPTTISAADAEEGATITVTFTPTEAKTYTATVTLTTPSVEPVTVSITGTATPAYYDARITSAQIATMYLDFPVTIPFDDYDELLAVAYVYDTSVASSLRMARLSSTIPPYTGVILYGSEGTYRFPKATQFDPLKHENKLTGTLVDISPVDALLAANAGDNEKVYTLGHGTDGYINFYRFSGSMIHANRAFLIYDSSSNARELSISWDEDMTTGIRTVAADDDDEWYTLQGVRLSKRPTRSGLYIHHGETVVVK